MVACRAIATPFPLVPSLEVHQLNAASNELARLAVELAGIRLPVGAAPSVGGITCQVAIGQPPTVVLCRLCDVPYLPIEVYRQLSRPPVRTACEVDR